MKPLVRLIINQPFGVNPNYYGKFGLKGHEGVDFKTRGIDPTQGWFYNFMGWQKVFAVCDGIVTISYSGPYGTHIYLQDKDGNQYLYAHLKNTRVSNGQRVAEGDVIAISGSSGVATGPHLHFSYRPKDFDVKNGYLGNIDPMILFPQEPFVMKYTVFNGDPNLMEQARQLLVQYSGGKIDCIFKYLVHDFGSGIFTTDKQISMFKDADSGFVFAFYDADIPNYSQIATAQVPGTDIILSAATPLIQPVLWIVYELVNALYAKLGIVGDDIYTPDEGFIRNKLTKIL